MDKEIFSEKLGSIFNEATKIQTLCDELTEGQPLRVTDEETVTFRDVKKIAQFKILDRKRRSVLRTIKAFGARDLAGIDTKKLPRLKRALWKL